MESDSTGGIMFSDPIRAEIHKLLKVCLLSSFSFTFTFPLILTKKKKCDKASAENSRWPKTLTSSHKKNLLRRFFTINTQKPQRNDASDGLEVRKTFALH